MPAKEIIDNMGTAARENRLKAAEYFLVNRNEFDDLLKLCFDTSYKLHHKAAWVVEFVLNDDLTYVLPQLDFFTASLSKLKLDSAVRPIAKSCALISQAYTGKNDIVKKKITEKHKELMISAAFDWLISDYKVAPKVHAMQIIFDFGSLPKADKWILRELKSILEQDLYHQKPGYKIRAQKILEAISKYQ